MGIAQTQRTVTEMPLLLAILFGLLTLLAVGCALQLVLLAIPSVLPLVPLLPAPGSYEIDGVPVSRWEFLRFVSVPSIVLGGLAGIAAWTMRHERPWAREVIMILWGTMLLVGFGLFATRGLLKQAEILAGVLGSCLAFSWWYLYFKPSTRAYYAAVNPTPPRLGPRLDRRTLRKSKEAAEGGRLQA